MVIPIKLYIAVQPSKTRCTAFFCFGGVLIPPLPSRALLCAPVWLSVRPVLTPAGTPDGRFGVWAILTGAETAFSAPFRRCGYSDLTFAVTLRCVRSVGRHFDNLEPTGGRHFDNLWVVILITYILVC